MMRLPCFFIILLLYNTICNGQEWEDCSTNAGVCIDTDVYQCSTTLITGDCPGGNNIRCCPAPGGVTSGQCTDQNSGLCKRTVDCTSSTLSNLCPGPANIMCCLEPSPSTSPTPSLSTVSSPSATGTPSPNPSLPSVHSPSISSTTSPTPSLSIVSSPSPSVSESVTPISIVTSSPSSSVTTSVTPFAIVTPSSSVSTSVTPTEMVTPSSSSSISPSPSSSVSYSVMITAIVTPTPSSSTSTIPTASSSLSVSPTTTASISSPAFPSATSTATPLESASMSSSASASVSPTLSESSSLSVAPSASISPSPSPSTTPTFDECLEQVSMRQIVPSSQAITTCLTLLSGPGLAVTAAVNDLLPEDLGDKIQKILSVEDLPSWMIPCPDSRRFVEGAGVDIYEKGGWKISMNPTLIARFGAIGKDQWDEITTDMKNCLGEKYPVLTPDQEQSVYEQLACHGKWGKNAIAGGASWDFETIRPPIGLEKALGGFFPPPSHRCNW